MEGTKGKPFFLSISLMLMAVTSVTEATIVLTYRTTVRDFLPATCMFLNNNDDIEQKFFTAWDTSISKPADDTCDDLGPGWTARMDNEEISGHPDFQTDGNPRSNGQRCLNEARGIPVGTCKYGGLTTGGCGNNCGVFRANDTLAILVGEYLETADSGIPKAPYCDEVERCGRRSTGNYQASNKEYFDMWFNDNKVHNKRIGGIIPLIDHPTEDDVLIYDSLNHNENFQFVDESLFDGRRGSDERRDSNYGPLDRFKSTRFAPEYEPFFINASGSNNPDPDTLRAWPQTLTRTNDQLEVMGMWFTTELHTFFTYNSSRLMTFEFSGDDDFWAYVNGRMVIDIGGVHGRQVEEVDLTLYESELGLVDGEIYTLDIFNAERQTKDSNFQVTTSLTPGCNVENEEAATVAFNTGSVTVAEFDELFKYSPNVEFNADNQTTTLLSGSDFSTINSIFTRIQQNIGRGFRSKFKIEIGGETDGFAFVIQDFGLVNYPLSGFPFFNLKNVPGAFAIVFDLCGRTSLGASCTGEEISVHFANSSETLIPLSGSRSVYAPITSRPKLTISGEVEIEIIFYGNPAFLEVFIDNDLYLRLSNFDALEFLGSNGAHVGFTATSSDISSDIVISEWELTTIEVSYEATEFDLSSLETDVGIADGVTPSSTVTIITKDGCGNLLDSGSLDVFIFAFYVEVPPANATSNYTQAVLPAEIVDNEDGTYTAQLITDVDASFDLYFSFGEGCEITENETSFPRTFNPPQGSDCFFETVTNATLVFPLPPETAAPTVFIDLDDDNSQLVKIASSTGGIFAFGALIAAVMVILYRNKWLREKVFVSDGKRYLAEVNTEMNSADEITKVTNQVMQTNQQLLRLENMAAENSRQKEIMELESQNRQISEENRMKRKELNIIDNSTKPERPTRKPRAKNAFDDML